MWWYFLEICGSLFELFCCFFMCFPSLDCQKNFQLNHFLHWWEAQYFFVFEQLFCGQRWSVSFVVCESRAPRHNSFDHWGDLCVLIAFSRAFDIIPWRQFFDHLRVFLRCHASGRRSFGHLIVIPHHRVTRHRSCDHLTVIPHYCASWRHYLITWGDFALSCSHTSFFYSLNCGFASWEIQSSFHQSHDCDFSAFLREASFLDHWRVISLHHRVTLVMLGSLWWSYAILIEDWWIFLFALEWKPEAELTKELAIV